MISLDTYEIYSYLILFWIFYIYYFYNISVTDILLEMASSSHSKKQTPKIDEPDNKDGQNDDSSNNHEESDLEEKEVADKLNKSNNKNKNIKDDSKNKKTSFIGKIAKILSRKHPKEGKNPIICQDYKNYGVCVYGIDCHKYHDYNMAVDMVNLRMSLDLLVAQNRDLYRQQIDLMKNIGELNAKIDAMSTNITTLQALKSVISPRGMGVQTGATRGKPGGSIINRSHFSSQQNKSNVF